MTDISATAFFRQTSAVDEKKTFFHGTRYPFKPGDLIHPGRKSNQGYGQPNPHVFFTHRPEIAHIFAESADDPEGHEDTRPRVYQVEPTGPHELDGDELPEDAKRAGSRQSKHPLRVVQEHDSTYQPDEDDPDFGEFEHEGCEECGEAMADESSCKHCGYGHHSACCEDDESAGHHTASAQHSVTAFFRQAADEGPKTYRWTQTFQGPTGYEDRESEVQGPLYHGGGKRWREGQQIKPGRKPNEWGDEYGKSIHVYFTRNRGTAADYARRSGGHVFEVEPSGNFLMDHNEGEFKTKHPLNVVRRLDPEEWHGDDHGTRTAGRGKPRRQPRPGAGAAGTGQDAAGGAPGVATGEEGPGTVEPRTVSFHPAARKELGKLDSTAQKQVASVIDSLASNTEGLQTHALTGPLKGWKSTKASRGHRVLHRDLDDGTLHVGYVGLHDYDRAINRLAVTDFFRLAFEGGRSATEHLRQTASVDDDTEYLDLYHRTSPESAAAIHRDKRMFSQENSGGRKPLYFSTFRGDEEGAEGSGYGEGVVHVRVPHHLAEIDDEFPSGEEHYSIDQKDLKPEHFVEEPHAPRTAAADKVWYHGSPRDLADGTDLVAGLDSHKPDGDHTHVWISGDPHRAATYGDVYEVHPHAEPKLTHAGSGEYYVPGATVKRKIGDPRNAPIKQGPRPQQVKYKHEQRGDFHAISATHHGQDVGHIGWEADTGELIGHRAHPDYPEVHAELLQRAQAKGYGKTASLTATAFFQMQVESAAVDNDEGIMVAFVPPPEIAQQLAQDDGQPADDLHITLAFLGKKSDYTREQLAVLPQLISAWAVRQKPVNIRIGGVGKFSNPDEDQHVLWASVDIPGGAQLHSDLARYLEGHGYRLPSEHGWNPHMTLRYVDRHFRFMPHLPEHRWTADAVHTYVGRDRHQTRLGSIPSGTIQP
ncbi:NAD(+)--rifampin ADP-ribosyltransferase [Streptomyces sp. NPDC005562]|uniref:NAD(+)--rifampin ADP-ribosyltransferase n=1 Tax=Streptomyces sp. NPDC005562 TaxID=3154890 RepID=UPI0033A7F984